MTRPIDDVGPHRNAAVVTSRWCDLVRASASGLAVTSVGLTASWLLGGRFSSDVRLALVVAALAIHATATIAFRARPITDAVVEGRLTRLAIAKSAWVVVAVLLALAVAAPPQRSHDVWGYTAYGRIVATHHANPYEHRPREYVAADPVIARMDRQWWSARAVYGPGFVGVSAIGAALSGGSALAARLFHQGLAAGAVVVVLLGLRRRGADTATVFFLGANPAVIGVVNGGHSDLLVGALLLAGAVALEGRRFGRAGAAFGAAALVKLVAVFPVVALGVWGVWRMGARRMAQVTAVSVAVVAGAYLVVGGVSALEPLRDASRTASRSSLWAETIDRGIRGLIADGWRGADAGKHVRERAALVAGALVFGWAVLVGWRGRRRLTAPTVAAVAGLGYLLLGMYVLPWYVGWILPAAAAARPRWSVWALMQAQAGLLLIAYVDRPGTPPGSALTRTLSTEVAPRVQMAMLLVVGIVLAFGRGDRAGRGRRDPRRFRTGERSRRCGNGVGTAARR